MNRNAFDHVRAFCEVGYTQTTFNHSSYKKSETLRNQSLASVGSLTQEAWVGLVNGLRVNQR